MSATTALNAQDPNGPLTAFGETKSITEWTLDPRARVWSEAILERLAEGMTPEQAIGTPVAGLETGRTRYLAFGERKTLRDWADDVRCEVEIHTLRSRIKAGWQTESALSTPARRRSGAAEFELIEAFGEANTVEEWARDPRAGTSLHNIRQRLKAGYSPEEAISKPTEERRHGLIEAFGERKSIRAWGDDPRSRASRMVITKRLEAGVPPEEAITRPMQVVSKHGFTAFGETKTLEEWARDPRCSVSEATISYRRKLAMSPEDAITKPSSFVPRHDESAIRPKGLASHTRCVVAFGEVKSISGWSKDHRSAVDTTTIRQRLLDGMEPEAAITTPSKSAPPVTLTAFGETKALSAWTKDPRCVVTEGCLYQRIKKGMNHEPALTQPMMRDWENEVFTAFGESKSLREWSKDSRCPVSYSTLKSRLANYGMAFELALIAPAAICTRGRYGEIVEAFGERKLLGEWMRDARCVVGRKTLGYRLRSGWELERALTVPENGERPVGIQGRFVEAFGERKNIRQWSLDSRCEVSESVLSERLKRGWSPERAIGEPALPFGQVAGVRRKRGPEMVFTAFGETRKIGAWAKDPRCVVRLPVLSHRLKMGWSPEEALTVLAGGRLAQLAMAA